MAHLTRSLDKPEASTLVPTLSFLKLYILSSLPGLSHSLAQGVSGYMPPRTAKRSSHRLSSHHTVSVAILMPQSGATVNPHRMMILDTGVKMMMNEKPERVICTCLSGKGRLGEVSGLGCENGKEGEG